MNGGLTSSTEQPGSRGPGWRLSAHRPPRNALARGPVRFTGRGPLVSPHRHAPSLTEACSSGHHHRMPAPLFANKPGHRPYGHSLAPGMPQKISWMPCICDPAREAAERGKGMSHVTLWCGACSTEDHRDTRFYEPPHEVGHHRPLSGWVTRPDVLAHLKRRPRATATAEDRSAVLTVTTLMICSTVCALATLAALLDAACSAATANSAGPGR